MPVVMTLKLTLFSIFISVMQGFYSTKRHPKNIIIDLKFLQQDSKKKCGEEQANTIDTLYV